jgi:hypothetical protein
MRSPVALVVLALALLTGSHARPAEPPPPSPEQKALDRFAGTWKTTYTVFKAEWTPEDKAGSATVTFARVLGGAYLQEKSDHADKTQGMAMRTYDAEKKAYRAWWFSSGGHSSESVGAWDGAARAFTWTATRPDFTTTARQRFTTDDSFDWDVVVKSPAGAVLYRMEGKSTRGPVVR